MFIHVCKKFSFILMFLITTYPQGKLKCIKQCKNFSFILAAKCNSSMSIMILDCNHLTCFAELSRTGNKFDGNIRYLDLISRNVGYIG